MKHDSCEKDGVFLYFLQQVGRICWQKHSKGRQNSAYLIYRGNSTGIVVIFLYVDVESACCLDYVNIIVCGES